MPISRPGLVFVLFHPTDEFLGTLDQVRHAVPDTVVVDNTPEPDASLHERLRATGVTLIDNRNVGGLSRAFNLGTERAFADGCDAVFLLDQDSRVDADFFATMTAALADAGDAVVAGPRIYETTMDVFMQAQTAEGMVDVDTLADGLIDARYVIPSGSVVSRAAWDLLGPYREDYFIEGIDVEYGLRAHAAHVPVVMVGAAVLRQRLGATTRAGRSFASNHAPWRRYYSTRNVLHAVVHHGVLRYSTPRPALYEIVKVVRYDPHRFRTTLAIAVGWWDAARGRLGTLQTLHPRLARFFLAGRPS